MHELNTFFAVASAFATAMTHQLCSVHCDALEDEMLAYNKTNDLIHTARF
jgi:hypothetical protein